MHDIGGFVDNFFFLIIMIAIHPIDVMFILILRKWHLLLTQNIDNRHIQLLSDKNEVAKW